jgi:hypothetical protein
VGSPGICSAEINRKSWTSQAASGRAENAPQIAAGFVRCAAQPRGGACAHAIAQRGRSCDFERFDFVATRELAAVTVAADLQAVARAISLIAAPFDSPISGDRSPVDLER